MSIKVYHNPRCSKSRMAIDYLTSKGQEFEVIEYLKEIPTKKELENVLLKLDMSPSELMRKGEADYKENIKGKDLTDGELIDLMIQYPKLIERPIVIKSDRAVIARPAERIDEIINI